jgi:tetratricopeptide (TPR) repeat protein
VTALCLAGIVYGPEPELAVGDLEADVALYMGSGNLEEAKKRIRSLLDRDPENLYGNLMQAYVHNISDEPEEAYQAYGKAEGLIGEYPDLEDDLLEALSMLALKTGRYEEARIRARERTREFGENILSRLIIALSSFSLNDDKKYEEHLTKAMEMGIVDPAFKLRLDSLVEDYETLQNIYIRSLLDRAKYEQQLAGSIWY